MTNTEPNTIALDSDFYDLTAYEKQYFAEGHDLASDETLDEFIARRIKEDDAAAEYDPAAEAKTAEIIKTMTPAVVDPLAAMKKFNQWIVWREEPNPKGGKPLKVPKVRSGEYNANPHNKNIWMSYGDAKAAADRLGNRFGVGFVFTANTKLFFFDLDKCINPETGEIRAEAVELIARFPGCMVERSVSGTGFHVVGTYEGDEPAHECKSEGWLELYTDKRFMALGKDEGRTGDAGVIATDWLNNLIALHFEPSADAIVADGTVVSAEWTTDYDPRWNGYEDIDEQLQKALDSQLSANQMFNSKLTFKELHNGSCEGYPLNTDGSGSSEADGAYFFVLAFWFGGNCDVMESVALAGPRYRDKWITSRGDRTWLQTDILSAVAKHRSGGGEYYRRDYRSDVEVVSIDDLNDRDVKKYNPKEKTSRYSLKPFPGIMESVVEETLRIANKPQADLSILSALIGMASGISGSYKTIGGTRFNLYGVGISETGTGKDKAMLACTEVGSAARTELGGQPGSGAALEDMLLEQNTKILFNIDEVAHFIASMNDAKQAHMASLGSNFLKLFSASRNAYYTRRLASSSNIAQKKCVNPCVSMMGFACPEKLGAALGKSGNVEDGLLGRVLFARGLTGVQHRRDTGEFSLPTVVYDKAELIHSRMGTDTVVSIDELADEKLDAVLRSFDAASEHSTNIFERALKARSYEKCERIAGVLAIWDDPLNPVIGIQHVIWAENMVKYSDEIILGFTDEHMHDGQVQADAANIIRVMERIASHEIKGCNLRQKELIDKGFIPKSQALRYSRLSSRDFDTAIAHLCALERIAEIKIDDKAKGISALCFK